MLRNIVARLRRTAGNGFWGSLASRDNNTRRSLRLVRPMSHALGECRVFVTPFFISSIPAGQSLTVVGPVTGKRYRFEAPGDIAAVDQMDGVGVAAVPNLRQVMNPAW